MCLSRLQSTVFAVTTTFIHSRRSFAQAPKVGRTCATFRRLCVSCPRTVQCGRAEMLANCDRCDGLHETECCPIYQLPRGNHRDAQKMPLELRPKEEATWERTPISEWNSSVSRLVMSESRLKFLLGTVVRQPGELTPEKLAMLLDDCESCFLSAEQGARLLNAIHPRSYVYDHVVSTRTLDRWNIWSGSHSSIAECYYNSWELLVYLDRDAAKFAGVAAQHSDVGRRCRLLQALFVRHDLFYEAHGDNLPALARRAMRREELLSRWRTVAWSTGWLARRIRALYDEVRFRPGHSGFEECRADFESKTQAQVNTAEEDSAPAASPSGQVAKKPRQR